MTQTWDVNFLGRFQTGTALYLTPPQHAERAMPEVGDTFRFTGGEGTGVEGRVVGRSAQTVDVEVSGQGVITIQPAPSYHPGRGSGTQNEVQTAQWVIV